MDLLYRREQARLKLYGLQTSQDIVNSIDILDFISIQLSDTIANLNKILDLTIKKIYNTSDKISITMYIILILRRCHSESLTILYSLNADLMCCNRLLLILNSAELNTRLLLEQDISVTKENMENVYSLINKIMMLS
jgi:hypothetical protein